jgi:hypothetical protein
MVLLSPIPDTLMSPPAGPTGAEGAIVGVGGEGRVRGRAESVVVGGPNGDGRRLRVQVKGRIQRLRRLEDRPVVGVVGAGLVAAFRRRQPHVEVLINEADLSDPTAGLRAGLVAVALTRTPFDGKGISTYVLRSDPVGGVTLRAR